MEDRKMKRTGISRAFRAIAGCALLLVGVEGVLAELPAGWGTNYNVSLAEARSRQRPLLVYFTASWCGPCKLMARTTFTNQTVLESLAAVCRVAVDIDQHPELAQQRDIRAVPTFKLLTSAGDEVATSTGYQEPTSFLEWLTKGMGEAKAVVAAQERADEKLAAAEQLLRQADSQSKRKAVADLLDLCAERNSAVREAAAARVATLAKSQPVLLLDGLVHPRLAVRIQAANLLRAQLGDRFDIDPWSDAPTRENEVARWRVKLDGKH
jgi:thioredoxin-like negative regulator of GroEL